MQTATETTVEGLDALFSGLADSYDKEMARIDRAIVLVERKQKEILDAAAGTSDVPIESIVRVKEREADELAVKGEPEAARAKLQEAEEVKAVPRRLEEAYSNCDLEKATLQGERRAAARKVLSEWIPSAVQSSRAEVRKMYAMLDRIAEEIKEFIDRTGNTPVLGKQSGIDANDYIDSLVAKDGEEERPAKSGSRSPRHSMSGRSR